MDAQSYISEIKSALATSPIVRTVTVLQERTLLNQGFFRARITLSNHDFLEVAEFFAIVSDRPQTLEYRYQWMDPAQKFLHKRWDNASHYPLLPNAPHHVHAGDEMTVEPGQSLSVIELLALLQSEIG